MSATRWAHRVLGRVVASVACGAVVLAACGSDAPLRFSDDPPILGFNYPVWSPTGYERAVNESDIEEIASTGAGWVVLSITWYQDSIEASCPAASPTATTSLDGLRRAAQLARSQGLDVGLKPMVDLPLAADRSMISPTDPDEWFRCYTNFMVTLADLANDEGIDLLIVGTELGGTVAYETHWRAVIDAVRDRYTGSVAYGANFSDIENVEFWDAVDLIGVSAYWPLALEPTTDAATLEASWATIIADLEPLVERWERQLLLTELGYRAQQGATVNPWDWSSTAPADEAEQAAAFASAAQAWSNVGWFGGALIWTWDDVLDIEPADDGQTYSPNGTQSLPVIEEWFTGSSGP